MVNRLDSRADDPASSLGARGNPRNDGAPGAGLPIRYTHATDVDEKLPSQGVVVLARDVEQGVVYENGGIKVTAFAVDHGPVKPALGYRVDFAGHSVVLSGDTRYSENLVRFSEGADVLIHEVMDPDAFRLKNPS